MEEAQESVRNEKTYGVETIGNPQDLPNSVKDNTEDENEGRDTSAASDSNHNEMKPQCDTLGQLSSAVTATKETETGSHSAPPSESMPSISENNESDNLQELKEEGGIRGDSSLSATNGTSDEDLEVFTEAREEQRKMSSESEKLQAAVSGIKQRGSLFGRKVSETLAKAEFEHLDPDVCVTLLRIPTMKKMSALNKKLKTANSSWLSGFLEADGLDVLLITVDNFSSKRVTQLCDAMLLLECVACVKTIMNSKYGLSFMVENQEYTRKLVKGEKT